MALTNDVTNETSRPPMPQDVSLDDVNMVTVSEGPLFEAIRDERFRVTVWPFAFIIFYMSVGFFGNAIVVYLFTCLWKRTKTTIFILTLAFVDLASCVFNMPLEAAMLWNPMTFDQNILCKISRFTTFVVSVSSSFVLVAIAIDRYLMVCRPFQSRTMGVLYAQRTCVVAVILGILVAWPSLLFYGTFTFYIHSPSLSNHTQVEGKTCLITNYYVDNNTFPTGFYLFLLIGHIVIFIVLSTLYILIGRSLFMSTNVDLTKKRRSSIRFFGISVVSAITGNLPSESRIDLSGNRSSGLSAVSSENIRCDVTSSKGDNDTVKVYVQDQNKNDKSNDVISDEGEDDSIPNKNKPDSSAPKENQKALRNPRLPLNVALARGAKEANGMEDPEAKNRLSSTSAGSEKYLMPGTPDSIRGIQYRSQTSVDARSRISRIVSEELRNSGVKEVSLKQNTLIMRMVTMSFIVSFLPYLILVMIRYSHKEMPDDLSAPAQIVYHVFLRTYFINSMINPFIYGFMNEEFRTKLKALFSCKCSSLRHV